MAGVKRRRNTDSDIHTLHKELDEVLCPICMDHPHNAVLLVCSSYEKGCRSYICDTSYRHSNCLDRFKKLTDNMSSNTALSSSLPVSTFSPSNIHEASVDTSHVIDAGESYRHIRSNSAASVQILEGSVDNVAQDSAGRLELSEASNSESLHTRTGVEVIDVEGSSDSGSTLKCPLCRGAVLHWEIVEEARKYLNVKKRSCSRESCSFSGNYQDLRRHARRIHPTTRPSEVDPSQERAWRCLERQREYGDIVSALRSAMPGALVVGDYVVENGDRLSVEREVGTNEINAPLLTTFFLFHMIGSIDGIAEPRPRSRPWSRHRRPTGTLPERRFLWGENLLGIQEDDEDEDDLQILSDAGDPSPIPRRRRRLNRSRSDDNS